MSRVFSYYWLIFSLTGALLLHPVEFTVAATFTVNSTSNDADGDIGDDFCDTGTTTLSGICTLRAALAEANVFPGADTINFAIGSGSVTITNFGFFVTEGATIDGTTQPGYTGKPIVEIDGDPLGFTGFDVSGDGTTIKGLAITGFSGYGIQLKSSNNIIESNNIGVAPDGITADGNGPAGVYINGNSSNTPSNNRIGGSFIGAGNLISGNSKDGVLISGTGATSNKVIGNDIGVDTTRAVALANGDHGVNITNNASGNTIGGSSYRIDDGNGFCAGDCNTISGNGKDGIIIQAGATNNTVEGNYLGAAGSNENLPVGNQDDGLSLVNVDANIIGSPFARNLIAYNNDKGIFSSSPNSNIIASNDIHSNMQLGIDWASNGVSTNDNPDTDGIANFPVIGTANNTNITGTIATVLNQPTTIHLYANSLCDSSNHGEGQRYLGSTAVTTDGTGAAAFNFEITAPVIDGEKITATASSTNGSSEFSLCFTYSGTPFVPDILVNTTDDNNDGNCNASHCSLREAINAVNVQAGIKTIIFDIPGSAPFIIQPTSPLPAITGQATIDGESQPGFSDDPVIEVRGTSAGVAANGIQISTSNVTMNSLAIGDFGGVGVLIDGASITNVTIENSSIGIGTDGLTNRGNGSHGISITGSSIGNTIEGGVIAFNAGDGISSAAAGIVVNDVIMLANGGLSIDVGADGATANDGDDSDGIQNFPVFPAVNEGSTFVLPLTTTPNTDVTIEVTGVRQCTDLTSGSGGAAATMEIVHSEIVISDGAGLTPGISVSGGAAGRFGGFVATATTDDRGTSEMTACAVVTNTDGVPNATDNCPFATNAGQEDLDGDGQGDVCDDDVDGDGQPNDLDDDDDDDGFDDDDEGIAGTDPFDPDDDDDGIRDGLDPNPGTPGDNACNSAVAVPIEFTHPAITTTVLCAAQVKVTVKSTTHVMGAGDLQIITPETEVESNVKVDIGGKVSVFSENLPQ